jgi:hypothetical protein
MAEEIQEMTSIAKANEAAARMEAANKRHEELLAREEALHVEKVLGGKADAGQEPIKTEETPEQYAKRIMQNG